MNAALPIMVVDDFQSMSRIIVTMLKQLGFADIDQASDGPSALQSIKNKKYGLVISDWEMRPMTGPQFVQALRENDALAHIPVLLITAGGGRADAAWLSGADGFLNKPFTLSALKSKIDEVCARSAGGRKPARKPGPDSSASGSEADAFH